MMIHRLNLASAFVQSWGQNVLSVPGGYYMTRSGAEFGAPDGTGAGWLGGYRDDHCNSYGAAGAAAGPLLGAGTSDIWLEFFNGQARCWADRALLASAAAAHGTFSVRSFCTASANADSGATAGKVASIPTVLIMRRRDLELVNLPPMGYCDATFGGTAAPRANVDASGAGTILVPDAVAFPCSATFNIYDNSGTLQAALTIAQSWGGDVIGHAPVPPINPLRFSMNRQVNGLVFADDFSRADGAPGANYAVDAGTWGIVNNKLRGTVTAANGYLRILAAGVRSDVHVQLQQTKNVVTMFASIIARWAGGAGGYYLGDVGGSGDATDPNKARLYYYDGVAFTRLAGDGAGPLMADNTPARLTFSLIGTALKVYTNGVLHAAAVNAARASGYVGLTVPNALGAWVDYDTLVVCSSRTITVRNLPANWTARAGGVVSAPAAANGTVTVDVGGAQLPTLLEILDDTGAVRSSTAASYGGDLYQLT